MVIWSRGTVAKGVPLTHQLLQRFSASTLPPISKRQFLAAPHSNLQVTEFNYRYLRDQTKP